MTDLDEVNDKKLIQTISVKINKMGWANIRELKEIVDDEYNKREGEFYEKN